MRATAMAAAIPIAKRTIGSFLLPWFWAEFGAGPNLCQWLSLDEQWLSEDELAHYNFNAMAEEQNIQEMIQTTVELEKEAAALENELNGEDL